MVWFTEMFEQHSLENGVGTAKRADLVMALHEVVGLVMKIIFGTANAGNGF
jgi:hypothetical protein